MDLTLSAVEQETPPTLIGKARGQMEAEVYRTQAVGHFDELDSEEGVFHGTIARLETGAEF